MTGAIRVTVEHRRIARHHRGAIGHDAYETGAVVVKGHGGKHEGRACCARNLAHRHAPIDKKARLPVAVTVNEADSPSTT